MNYLPNSEKLYSHLQVRSLNVHTEFTCPHPKESLELLHAHVHVFIVLIDCTETEVFFEFQ